MFWYETSTKTLDSLKALVRERKNARIKSILSDANPSDFTDCTGTTVFHLSAKYGNIDLIKFLLESGYDMDVRNLYDTTPLHMAILHNNFGVVKFLFDANANIFARNSFNQTPVKLLLEKRKNLPGSMTRQLVCKLKGSGLKPEDMAKVLLEVDNSLEFALLLKDADVTRAMLNFTEEISIDRAHDLLIAAINSHDMENIKALLHNGHKATYRRQKFLENMANRINGSPLMLESARPFLQQLAYLDVIDEPFVQVLEKVFATSSKHVLELLLECEVDIVVRNKFGRELLVHVLVNQSEQIIELLRDKEFNVDARDKGGETGLHTVTKHDLPERIDFLLSRGANPNVKDKSGRAALHCAWEIETVVPLLRGGANVQVIDYNGISVFDKTKKLTDWMQVLLAHLAVVEAQGVSIKRKIADRINSIIEFKDFYDTCKNQIKWMKDQVICDDLTLFEVLVKKPQELAGIVLDREIVATMLHRMRDYKLHTFYLSTIEINFN